MAKLKVIQIGMGPIGQKMIEFLLERADFEIVGAVDKDSEKIGKDLGKICSVDNLNVVITDSINKAVENNKPDVAILTTVSSMEKIVSQVEEIISLGIPVVSTCEELSYPWDTSKDLAERIDKKAKENNVAVMSTGVNPGYLMDSFPIFLTAVCQKVNKITVKRIQNAAFRRISFQKKIGASLTLEEFEKRKKEGTLRHVGLTESVQMIANRMGWKLDKIEDILTPIIADKKIETDAMTIEKGKAAGVQQIGRGIVSGEEKITLIFRASVGETEPQDTVEIEGNPNITSSIKGGVNGDIATCAITINAAKQILNSSPGLKTMTDIPMVSYFS